MSEKTQRTAASLREKMIHRYSDGLEHKHNKDHQLYRLHCRSHPAKSRTIEIEETSLNGANGTIREFKLRKVRKRLDKGQFH